MVNYRSLTTNWTQTVYESVGVFSLFVQITPDVIWDDASYGHIRITSDAPRYKNSILISKQWSRA